MPWYYALILKFTLLPVIAWAYWLITVRGSTWLGSLLPKNKWTEILTRERYSWSWADLTSPPPAKADPASDAQSPRPSLEERP